MTRLLIAGAALAALGAAVLGLRTVRPDVTLNSTVTIPFELVNRHIVLPVSVNGSKPLSFILDTGDKFAVIDLARARTLGLALRGSVAVKGIGAQTTSGAFVDGGSFTLEGLAGFRQPVTLAIPLENLGPKLGRDCDGLLGADFIDQFVVELDYEARVIRLHDKGTFTYAGPGQSMPLSLREGHPIIDAVVTPVGGAPIGGRFKIDVGANGLTLHSPFVAEHGLPGGGLRTVRAAGGGGTGGAAAGRIGRVAEFRIGGFTLREPLVLFSEDRAGSFSEPAIQGNIGEVVLSRFRLFLDYGHGRVIFEPASGFAQPFDRAFSGLVIEADRPEYRTFRVTEVQDDSPASRSGLLAQDVITAVDGRAAADLTLSLVLEALERPTAHAISVRRAARVLHLTITPESITAR